MAVEKLANNLPNTPLAHIVKLAQDIGIPMGQINEARIAEDQAGESELTLVENGGDTDE